MEQKSNRFLSFLKELFVVIIGILIALSINTWNENRKDQEFIDKALFAINEEINLNKTEIQEILDKHLSTIDTIGTYLENDSVSLKDIFGKTQGFQVADLKNIGLRFFVANKAELIDYEIISKLSEIEFSRENLRKKTDKMADFAYDNLESTTEEAKYKLAIYMGDIIDSEGSLLEKYTSYLDTESTKDQDASDDGETDDHVGKDG